MKKFILLTFIVQLITLVSCTLNISPDTPGCIQDKIKEFSKAQVPCESGKSVKEYIFQNTKVYVFDPGTCGNDMGLDVYDSACNYLGFLGGIAGISEINGEEFSTAVFTRIVWKD